MRFVLTCLIALTFCSLSAQPPEKNLPPENPQINFRPSAQPDRILLTWTDEPSTTQTITWRTDTTITIAYAQLALADPSPDFDENTNEYRASTSIMGNEFSVAAYHQVTLKNLTPSTTYAYRVGSGNYWSEWIQFTTAHNSFKPFSFIYLGDAQNNLYSHWTRVVRAAYAEAPQAKFILHAGDLINHSQNDYEWASWFNAADLMNKTIPTIAIPGNHEYVKNLEGEKVSISPFWHNQFNFPKNGPEGLEDRCFYSDIQNVRVIGLDSNQDFERQAKWLKKVLKDNPNRWTFVIFHHPVVSAAKGRANESVLKFWKPILDRYKVDIVFQGHDHTYARAQNLDTGTNAYEANSGTVYVVSVSGTKMYTLTEQFWMKRSAENTQLYQVVDVNYNQLTYRSFTPDGKVYDAFRIEKNKREPNILNELPTDYEVDRRFNNTLTEQDHKDK